MSVIEIVGARFAAHPRRHTGVSWPEVLARLEADARAVRALERMEETGGEPDVVGREGSGFVVFDCSAESPSGRRSLCYDAAAHAARKVAKPSGSAIGMAEEMGVRLLDESEYARLQELGEFDLKSSSWLAAPSAVRDRGGAIFGDRRYGRVFTYHNGAESYYASRGWRGSLRV